MEERCRGKRWRREICEGEVLVRMVGGRYRGRERWMRDIRLREIG